MGGAGQLRVARVVEGVVLEVDGHAAPGLRHELRERAGELAAERAQEVGELDHLDRRVGRPLGGGALEVDRDRRRRRRTRAAPSPRSSPRASAGRRASPGASAPAPASTARPAAPPASPPGRACRPARPGSGSAPRAGRSRPAGRRGRRPEQRGLSRRGTRRERRVRGRGRRRPRPGRRGPSPRARGGPRGARPRRPPRGGRPARGQERRGARPRPGGRSGCTARSTRGWRATCTPRSRRSTRRPSARAAAARRGQRAAQLGGGEEGEGQEQGEREVEGEAVGGHGQPGDATTSELRATSSQPLVWPSPQAWFTVETAQVSPWCCARRTPETAAPARHRRAPPRSSSTRSIPLSTSRRTNLADARTPRNGRRVEVGPLGVAHLDAARRGSTRASAGRRGPRSPGRRRAPPGSRACGGRRSGSAARGRRGGARRAVAAAWMSAAGSKRVKVVQRKFIGLAAARAGSSVRTSSGQPREGRVRGEARRGPRVVGRAAARRRPGSRRRRRARRSPPAAAGLGGRNSRGSSRTGSPRPSQTPFEPSFTAGPV